MSNIQEMAKQLIEKKKFTDQIPLDNIAHDIVEAIKGDYPEYKIEIFDAGIDLDCFYVSKAEVKKKDSMEFDFDDLFRIKPEKPMTKEAQKITNKAKELFKEILIQLDVVHPSKYQEILKELDMKELKRIPDFNMNIFDFWSRKIIENFKITNKTELVSVIKNIITFFDVIFPDYLISYVKFKSKERLPVYIKRRDGDDFGWILEITLLRRSIYFTYLKILEKLNRKSELPKDPDFWLTLVVPYEKMGLTKEAAEVGEIGLSLKPRDLTELTDIVTFYFEKNKPQSALKYLKLVGKIFDMKKQTKQAQKTWETVVRIEPQLKSNWLSLAAIYQKLGEKEKAQKCETKANSMK